MQLFGDGGCVRVDVSRGEGNEWLRLNDLHRESGGDTSKQPAEWLRQMGTRRLVAEHSGDSQSDVVSVVSGGTDPGTWARWEIAIAYAEWLSPSFHLRVIREWRRFGQMVRSGGGDAIATALQAIAGAISQQAQSQRELAERVERLECTSRGIQAGGRTVNMMDEINTVVRAQVAAGMKPTEGSARLVIMNRLANSPGVDWNGGGRGWRLLPEWKAPEARKVLGLMLADARSVIRRRGPVGQGNLFPTDNTRGPRGKRSRRRRGAR